MVRIGEHGLVLKKAFVFSLLVLGALRVDAQISPDVVDPSAPTVLTRGQLPAADRYSGEGMQDYGNLFLSLSGIRDSSMPYSSVTPNGSVVRDYGGYGGQIGAGFNAYHRIQHGSVWFAYSGSYNRFDRNEFRNGTNQTLSAAYSKMLSRRWTVRATEGMIFTANLGSTYSLVPTTSQFAAIQPYSQKAFFNSSSLTLGYQATLRMSYFFGGDFSAAVYKPSQAAGYTSLSGVAGSTYRFTRRTSLTASYTLSGLNYNSSNITSRVQTGALTLSHLLTRRIEVGASIGLSQVNSSGTATIYFQGVPTSDFVRGTYKQVTLTPNFTGSIFRTGRRSRFGITGGEGISGGNGIYLTSRNIFVNGMGNYQVTPRLSLSGQVGFSRLSSVANAASNYSATTYNFTAGYQVRRHIYASAAYSGWRFPQYGTINRFDAHRITIGVVFATKDFPLPY
jgi:hypothetical protein